MQPLNITIEDKGKQSQEVVFPWAQATYGDKFTKVGLLKNLMGASTEEKSNQFGATFGVWFCRSHHQNY